MRQKALVQYRLNQQTQQHPANIFQIEQQQQQRLNGKSNERITQKKKLMEKLRGERAVVPDHQNINALLSYAYTFIYVTASLCLHIIFFFSLVCLRNIFPFEIKTRKKKQKYFLFCSIKIFYYHSFISHTKSFDVYSNPREQQRPKIQVKRSFLFLHVFSCSLLFAAVAVVMNFVVAL